MSQKTLQIYLDYGATTPPCFEAIALMQAVLSEQWGNPASLHTWGQRAAMVLETARSQVAQFIHAPNPESIIFTGGGTEADNLAIAGVARQYPSPQHLIISAVEHSAIAESANRLERQGWQVTRLPVNARCRLNPLDLKAAIQPNTVLVSIIYGQSEVGTLQPIAELAAIAHHHQVLFHTDAVQVAGRLPIDVQALDVDLLSLSAHKIYGPQGSGALYVKEGVGIRPLLMGGGQEQGLRSGTPGLPAIAGFGAAAERAERELTTEPPRLMALRDRLFAQLADCTYLKPTGDRLYRLPHHVSFLLNVDPDFQSSVTGKTLVRQLNMAGIGISAGSACHSGKLSPSPILLAMGYDEVRSLGGIRLTLGRDTTIEDIDWTAMVVQQVLDRLLTKPLTLAIGG